jgi:hypothetical protein
MSEYIKTTNLRQFANSTFLVKGIYNPYFDWWLDDWVKKTHRTFIKFPRSPHQILANWTEEIEEVKKLSLDNFELREKFWNKETSNFEFHKIKEKTDRDFFKIWKKVFDIDIQFDKEVEVERWGKDWKEVVKTSLVRVAVVGTWKIKNMILALVDEQPPMREGKDKAWNVAMVPEWDWEDTFKDKLVWKFIKMKVIWEGMDTKYLFSEGKEFITNNEDIEEDVFTSVKWRVKLPQEEIDIDTLPF